jgi:predicted kinase
MKKKLPRLVIVSGPSASGKSSIARELAAELELALLAKDDMKEGLFDTLGNPDGEAQSARLDLAAYVLLERLGRRILESGVGLIVEGNFVRNRHEVHLGPLVARSRAVVLHCAIEPTAMARRLKKRVEGKKKRHPGHTHPDPELLEDPEKLVESRDDLEPPNLDVPVKRLDTTREHNPSAARVAKWVKKSTQLADDRPA